MDTNRNIEEQMQRDYKNYKHHLETKKRCKALENRLKEKSLQEEERRKGILLKRREEMKFVTEKFQRMRRHIRTTSNPHILQEHNGWECNYNLDEALKIVLGTNTPPPNLRGRSMSATNSRPLKTINSANLRPASSDPVKRFNLNPHISLNKFNILPSSPQIRLQAFNENFNGETHLQYMHTPKIRTCREHTNLTYHQSGDPNLKLKYNSNERIINRPNKIENCSRIKYYKEDVDKGYTNKWKLRAHLMEPSLIAVDPSLAFNSSKSSSNMVNNLNDINLKKQNDRMSLLDARNKMNINPKQKIAEFGMVALNQHTNVINSSSNIKEKLISDQPKINLKFDSTINGLAKEDILFASQLAKNIGNGETSKIMPKEIVPKNDQVYDAQIERKSDAVSQIEISKDSLEVEKSENSQFYLHRMHSPNVAIVQPMLHLPTNIFKQHEEPNQKIEDENIDLLDNLEFIDDLLKKPCSESSILKQEKVQSIPVNISSNVTSNNNLKNIDITKKINNTDNIDQSNNAIIDPNNAIINDALLINALESGNDLVKLNNIKLETCKENDKIIDKNKSRLNSLIPKPYFHKNLQTDIDNIASVGNIKSNNTITSNTIKDVDDSSNHVLVKIKNDELKDKINSNENPSKALNNNYNNLANFYASKNIIIPTISYLNSNVSNNQEVNFPRSNTPLSTLKQNFSIASSSHHYDNNHPIQNVPQVLEFVSDGDQPKGILKRPSSNIKIVEVGKQATMHLQRSFSSDAIPNRNQPKKSVRFAGNLCNSTDQINVSNNHIKTEKFQVPSPPTIQRPNGLIHKTASRQASTNMFFFQKLDEDMVKTKFLAPNSRSNLTLKRAPTEEEIDNLWKKVKDVLNITKKKKVPTATLR